MPTPDLLLVSITAFTAVFLLLGILSGLMALIMRLFPARRPTVTAVEVAVISAAAGALIPGARVVHIEEVR